MARFTDFAGRSYVSVNFAEDEDAALNFVDKHWDRIVSISFNTNPKEVPGWTVYYYKVAAPEEKPDSEMKSPAKASRRGTGV